MQILFIQFCNKKNLCTTPPLVVFLECCGGGGGLAGPVGGGGSVAGAAGGSCAFCVGATRWFAMFWSSFFLRPKDAYWINLNLFFLQSSRLTMTQDNVVLLCFFLVSCIFNCIPVVCRWFHQPNYGKVQFSLRPRVLENVHCWFFSPQR